MAKRDTTPPPSAANLDSLPDSARIGVDAVAWLFDVSQNTIWRWSKGGLLPKPSKTGPNTTTWSVGQIRASLAAITQNQAA